MRTIRFETTPLTRKIIQGFFWLQMASIGLVFALIALQLPGLAMGLSFLTLFLFLTVFI